jgi:hypothetical protein
LLTAESDPQSVREHGGVTIRALSVLPHGACDGHRSRDEPGESQQARRWSPADLDGVMRSMRREYGAPLTVVSDLVCIRL